MKNFLLTCDLIGKIKLVEFPNVYKMPNVFLYNDEEIKFCDFLNNQNIKHFLNQNHLFSSSLKTDPAALNTFPFVFEELIFEDFS